MTKKTNMRGYICSCGRVHFYDQNIINAAIEDGQEILMICGGCGTAWCIGADTDFDENGNPAHSMYRVQYYNSMVIDANSFVPEKNKKAYYRIIYSRGKKVLMKTGHFARSYTPTQGFLDTLCPDLACLQSLNTSLENIQKYLKEHSENARTVSMNWIEKNFTEEELRYLWKSFDIPNFDWSQTKLGKQKFR